MSSNGCHQKLLKYRLKVYGICWSEKADEEVCVCVCGVGGGGGEGEEREREKLTPSKGGSFKKPYFSLKY